MNVMVGREEVMVERGRCGEGGGDKGGYGGER